VALVAAWLLLRGGGESGTESVTTKRAAQQPSSLSERDEQQGGAARLRLEDFPAPTISRVPRYPSGALSGRVVSSETGEGIANAELTFEQFGVVASVTSAADGAFEFVAPRAGRHSLAAVTASGFWPYAPSWGASAISFNAQENQRVDGFRVVLVPRRKQLGIVVDPSDKPVANAKVRIVYSGTESELTPLSGEFVSSASGEFSFEAPVGALLEAHHQNFAATRARVEHESRRPLKLRFHEAAKEPEQNLSISGRVFDGQGVAAEGAIVTLHTGADEPAIASALVDADGRFQLTAYRNDRSYSLRARLSGWVPAVRDGVRAGSQNIELRLGKGFSIRGRVVDSQRRSVTAFAITLKKKRGTFLRDVVSGSAFVDGNGEFELVGVPEGDLLVSAGAAGYAPSTEVAVRMGAANPSRIELVLTQGARVFGRVFDEESRAPIADARVSFEAELASVASMVPLEFETRSKADGSFELKGISAGMRSIEVQFEGRHTRIISGLRASENGSIGPIDVGMVKVSSGERPGYDFVGIGVGLGVVDEKIVIHQVIPTGGAYAAGVQKNDRMLRVDGVAVEELGFTGVMDHVRGPENSTVTLLLERDGKTFEKQVARKRLR
jgi:hypothetical protein